MSTSYDIFAHSTTAHLRSVAVAYCPQRGASRMNRVQLVELLTTSMLGEEVYLIERAARKPLHQLDVVDHLLPGIHRRMEEKYGRLVATYLSAPARLSHPSLGPLLAVSASASDEEDPDSEWPQPITSAIKDECMTQFLEGTKIAVGATCAVCGRRTFSKDLLFKHDLTCSAVDITNLDLTVLQVTDPHLLTLPEAFFRYGDARLDGLALDKEGIHIGPTSTQLDICDECEAPLSHRPARLPALALANGTMRGALPPHLQDVTWLEERLCARFLGVAYVVRLYDFDTRQPAEQRSRVMKGHTCSFPLNTVSTATALPWNISAGGAVVSCIVIGPRKPTKEDLKGVFTVRRKKVHDLLHFLRQHFQDYPQFPLDQDALDQLPEHDVPDYIIDNVVHELRDGTSVQKLFERETAGLDKHPGMTLDGNDTGAGTEAGNGEDADSDEAPFLEHHGLVDINGITVSSHARTAAAFNNATGGDRPDLVVRHGSCFVQDYNNPKLFPGMFPTLYPWGTGGFEAKRKTPLSFARHASYLLDLSDNAFRRHWSYVFVVANIKQRRAIHLGSRLACRSRDVERFSAILRAIDAPLVKQVSEHLTRGGSSATLLPDERKVFDVLKQCQLASANVPGSKAIMTRARADIRALVGQFGIFHIFLTLNPSANHSPVFHIFFGDKTVKLDIARPTLPDSKERAMRVANDPVAGSDYFHFHISAVFQYLLGWDLKKKESTPSGGIFGRISAFVTVKEHTMRGQLHAHSLIWLEGGLNPADLRKKLDTDHSFRDRYLKFFDDLILHGLPPQDPPVGLTSDGQTKRYPRQERPPDPSHPNYATLFNQDCRLLAEAVQRHRCTFTCFKGGRSSCRFLFPHALNVEPYYDPDTKSIHPRVTDATLNYYNDVLLAAVRHNMDIRSVQSGLSSVSAVIYITDYATKSDETPANQISMINTVYERMVKADMDTSDAYALLCRCVMQFGRERQLHAQQASTYVRDLGDVMQSHFTLPMLTGQLLRTVGQLYGTPLTDEHGNEDAPTAGNHAPGRGIGIAQDASGSNSSSDQALQGDRLDGRLLQDEDGSNHAQSGAAAHTGRGEAAEESANEAGEEDEEDEEGDVDWLPLNTKGLAHQFDDYFYRGPTLAHLHFYDFVRFVQLIKKPHKPNKNHHALGHRHPNVSTHCHRYRPNVVAGIPRAICQRFPKPNSTPTLGDTYCCAMLAHFQPFGVDAPLKSRSETWEGAFARAVFSSESRRIMKNWNALFECEDARDADQLSRRKREATRSSRTDLVAVAQGNGGVYGNPNTDIEVEDLLRNGERFSEESTDLIAVLTKSGWLDTVSFHSGSRAVGVDLFDAVFSSTNKKKWTKELALLEANAKAERSRPRAVQGILADQLAFGAENTTTLVNPSVTRIRAHSTKRLHWVDRPPHELLTALVVERNLTPSQSLAFTIAGRQFFEEKHGVSRRPLRLLMHGEAGTGKTVVVRLLRELLDAYGQGASILFVAPTGKAAAAVGGATQHAAFGIEVHRRGQTREEIVPESAHSVARRMVFLQDSLKAARWVFFDEVSMTSCEVMAAMDEALRIGTRNMEEPFGGINVIFAGDLCQLPPVASAALYSGRPSAAQRSEARSKVELGRAAWLHVNEVVEFTEQMRMKDADMAQALRRLRLRQCTPEDVKLFNANVLMSDEAPHGRRLTEQANLLVLTRTNDAVRRLNSHKASMQAHSQHEHLVISHARDKADVTLTAVSRDLLLSYNARNNVRIGAGRLPLFRGMPVIFKGGNQAVALGLTNGAFGTVVAWDLVSDRFGLPTPKAAVVCFDPDATWSLTGLPPGCVPVYPRTTSFSFGAVEDTHAIGKVSRSQLPLQPRFAMTIHSAQGITHAGGVVVDLRRGGFEAYVAASRATKRESIYLVHSVTRAQLNSPPLPQALQAELRRLAQLAKETEKNHGHDHWRLDLGLADTDGGESPSKRRRAA